MKTLTVTLDEQSAQFVLTQMDGIRRHGDMQSATAALAVAGAILDAHQRAQKETATEEDEA